MTRPFGRLKYLCFSGKWDPTIEDYCGEVGEVIGSSKHYVRARLLPCACVLMHCRDSGPTNPPAYENNCRRWSQGVYVHFRDGQGWGFNPSVVHPPAPKGK